MEKRDFIYNKDKYIEEVSKIKSSSSGNNLDELLEIALDTRKFEIELYWKRATYFWAFIVSIFTAYFVILSSEQIACKEFYLVLISFIGYFFSLGWYYGNKGSKYWQENWEAHINNLGEYTNGKIFKIIKYYNNEKKHKWIESAPYSVSKINQFISGAVVVFSVLNYIISVILLCAKIKLSSEVLTIHIIVFILIFFVILIIFTTYKFKKHTKSFVFQVSEKENQEKHEPLFFIK